MWRWIGSAATASIGQGSGFYVDFDLGASQIIHFTTYVAASTFPTTIPHGAYYYGADISVHPDYRGRGVGKLLYAARKQLVLTDNRRGIVAGGMIPGYARYRDQMTVGEYVARVVQGVLRDPTLTFQLAQGFESARNHRGLSR